MMTTEELTYPLPPTPDNCVQIVIWDGEFVHRSIIQKDSLEQFRALQGYQELAALAIAFRDKTGEIGDGYAKWKSEGNG